jgi:hypothetical protein
MVSGTENDSAEQGHREAGASVEVVIGTPINWAKAYMLDKFLTNQKEIQSRYRRSELVLATVEHDLAEELEALLDASGIGGRVLRYETVKPDYARSPVWNIVCGAEAIREYMLSQTKAEYLLRVDADMTYAPDIIEVMEREIRDHDGVFSGYPLRDYGLILAGGGCCMLHVDTVRRITPRCVEFRNGNVLYDDVMLEADLFRLGARIRKGFFLPICHYRNEDEARCIEPRPVGILRSLVHIPLVRYVGVRASLMLKCDVPGRLRFLLFRARCCVASLSFLPRRGRGASG